VLTTVTTLLEYEVNIEASSAGDVQIYSRAKLLYGVQQSEFITPVDGEFDTNDGTLYLGANYSNRLTDTLTFNSALNIDIAESNTLTVWDNNLSVRVSDRISLSVGILTRNNSDIVGELGERTDTTTRFGVNFGL